MTNDAIDYKDQSVIMYGPVLVAYLSPLRIVTRGLGDEWETSIGEINSGSYNAVKLHRLSCSVICPWLKNGYVHIGYDGSIVLPDIYKSKESAVVDINRLFGQLFLGGVFCKAVTVDDIDEGMYYPSTQYVRTFGQAEGFTPQLHATLRQRMASPLHAISLLNPETVNSITIIKAAQVGENLGSKIPELSLHLLLQGFSDYFKRDWAGCVSVLWICLEQVLSHLWKTRIIAKANKSAASIPGRVHFLDDSRTWTSSTRLELLFQQRIVSMTAYSNATIARKARNALAHSGALPTESQATALTSAVGALIQVAAKDVLSVKLVSLVAKYQKQNYPAKKKATKPKLADMKEAYWLRLVDIPGDATFSGEYEQIQDNGSICIKNAPCRTT